MKKIGLSNSEATRRLLKYGLNSLKNKKKISPIWAFLKKLNSPLLLILIVVSVLSFFLGEKTNAVIILLMVFSSATLDFFNTYKSERAVEDLIARVRNTATVWRNGKKKELSFKFLVPGDVVELSAGDVIPADCRILESKDFFVNQAVLTGESFPVEKHLEQRNGKEVLSIFENPAQIFTGTSVVTGFATAEILVTGTKTEFGKIAVGLLRHAPETDFEKGIKKFSYFIMRVTFVLVVLVFFFNFLLGRGLFESFLFAIAIAIGLTPELLPMIVSIALSRGSLKMAKKDVIVKNLSAIENFGGMNIFCTDKTGTLTEGRIVLVKYVDIWGNNCPNVFLFSYLSSVFHTGVTNPLDKAILEYQKTDVKNYQKVDEIPFDFERKRDSMVIEKEGQKILITKGAPENIFEIVKFCQLPEGVVPLDQEKKRQLEKIFMDLSAEGFRVLAVAQKEIGDHRQVYEKEEERDMIFVGFSAFLDPPKETASAAIKDLEELGVEVKILTGDSDLLTQKICRDLQIFVKGTLVGRDILEMSDEELMPVAKETTIFARITPEQKERIILILKKAGNTVGYLGDGINDAPALKSADVGVSVNNAVDVAKETADIILLQKSLAVLKEGIIEGRKTFQNTLKYIEMGLSSNFGNMLSMTCSSLFLPFLPMLPTQILLNNFLYDFSQVTLPSDNVDNEDVKKPPRWDIVFLKKYMLTIGPISSIFDFVTFGVLFLVFNLNASAFQTGWFMESLATQVFVIFIIRSKKIPFFGSKPSLPVILCTVFVVSFAWFLTFTKTGQYFNFQALSWQMTVSIMVIVVIYLGFVEVVKRLFYKSLAKKTY